MQFEKNMRQTVHREKNRYATFSVYLLNAKLIVWLASSLTFQRPFIISWNLIWCAMWTIYTWNIECFIESSCAAGRRTRTDDFWPCCLQNIIIFCSYILLHSNYSNFLMKIRIIKELSLRLWIRGLYTQRNIFVPILSGFTLSYWL